MAATKDYHLPKKNLFLLFGFVLVWSVFSLVSHASFITVNDADGELYAQCESPSLPRGSFHVIVGAYKYRDMEAGISFDGNNYLWNLGLTNADIFWYRRVQPEVPLRPPVEGPCGMRLHERLLLPNYGRDGAAFVDHILDIYDSPPASIMFLHGHAAIAWHTSCEAVFARSAYVYRDLVQQQHNNVNHTVQNHMMTLTSPELGTRNFVLNYYGSNETQQQQEEKSSVRRLHSNNTNDKKTKSPCDLFKERWHTKVFATLQRPNVQSCCASFILPGNRIQRFSREFYQEWQALLTNQSYPDQGRECFEFIVYEMFGEHTFKKQELQTFYDEADGLVHGKIQLATSDPDEVILHRMKQCKMTEQTLYRRYVRKRKWRNTWKRLGFYKTPTKD